MLGLRTLSVLQDSIDQVGMSREQLKAWPLDDQGAFDVLNKDILLVCFNLRAMHCKVFVSR